MAVHRIGLNAQAVELCQREAASCACGSNTCASFTNAGDCEVVHGLEVKLESEERVKLTKALGGANVGQLLVQLEGATKERKSLEGQVLTLQPC